MSHRIIIGSTASLPPSDNSARTADASAVEAGSVETSVTYAPPHPEAPQTTLAKVAKIMKLVKRIEEVAAGGGDEHD